MTIITCRNEQIFYGPTIGEKECGEMRKSKTCIQPYGKHKGFRQKRDRDRHFVMLLNVKQQLANGYCLIPLLVK